MRPTLIIDTHTHIQLCNQPIDQLIQTAQANSVIKLINVAIDIESSQSNIKLANAYPSVIYPTIGIHPNSYHDYAHISSLNSLIKRHRPCAIGECGLDFYRDANPPKQDQIEIFLAQLELARTHQLPVIIHSRNANDELIELLPRFKDITKVIHCFSSSWDIANRLNDENTYFSFTGLITFSKKGKTVNTIKHLPMHKIMLETDCPYLTPKRYAGQSNEPSFVIEVAKKIADIKGLPLTDVMSQTTKTAMSFFGV